MGYVALRRIKVGLPDGTAEFREPGDPVPEAATWKNVGSWVRTGYISPVPEGNVAEEVFATAAPEPAATSPPGNGHAREGDGEAEDEPGLEDVIDAIAKLDEGDGSLWTQCGAPRVAAVRELLGTSVSAAEVRDAWAELQDRREGA